jgi:hypothetical protein
MLDIDEREPPRRPDGFRGWLFDVYNFLDWLACFWKPRDEAS